MNTHTFTPVALSLSNQINSHKETLTTDDIKMLTLTLQMCTNAPNLLDKEDRCQGITDSGCGYLSGCNKICNKCGKLHNGHKLPADKPIVQEDYTQYETVKQEIQNSVNGFALTPLDLDQSVTFLDLFGFLELLFHIEETYGLEEISYENTNGKLVDIEFKDECKLKMLVDIVCKRKNYPIPTT